jgi:hypothetical protein
MQGLRDFMVFLLACRVHTGFDDRGHRFEIMTRTAR